MHQITTRNAVVDDLPRLLVLWTEQRDILVQLDPRLEAWMTDKGFDTVGLRQLVERERDGVVLVAERASRIIGFVSVNADTGTIAHFVVDAHDGGGGVGTALLNAVRQWAAEQQVSSLTVDVPRHHAVQQAFWRAKGAVTVETLADVPVERMRLKGGA